MTIPPLRKRHTILIIKTCEFGEPGDRIRPEPYDVAALLVETRGVAVYEEEAEQGTPTGGSPQAIGKREAPARRGKDRSPAAGP